MTQLESRTLPTGGERQKIFIKGSSRRQVFTVYDLIISMFLVVGPGLVLLGEDIVVVVAFCITKAVSQYR